MKTLGITTVLLSTLAAVLWAFALRDSLPAAVPIPGSNAEQVELRPYPGADDLVVRRLVADAADGLFSPSPDGTLISQVDWETGDLTVRNLRTGHVRRVTNDGDPGGSAFATFSMFSPDGHRIAYEWTRDGHFDWALRVVDLESGEVRQLFHDPETVVFVELGSWSPDGATIALTLYLRDGSHRIVLIDAMGGGQTVLRSFDWRAPGGLEFSPDGQWLAYNVPRSESSRIQDIYLLAVDGSREVPLVRSENDDMVAGWMPGGESFFYLSGQDGRTRLLAVDLEGSRMVSEPRVVRSDLWHISPRGFSENAFFYALMPERRKAYTARMDPEAGLLTSPLTPIVPPSTMEWTLHTAWSPDGDRVAYMAGTYLIIRSLATGAERSMRVPFRSSNTLDLAWSPTDDVLAVVGPDDQGRYGVHTLRLADGSVELVLRSDAGVVNGLRQWARDGRSLYVLRYDIGGSEHAIVHVDLETRDERELYRAEPFRGFAISPDERHIAVGQEGGEGEPDRILLVPLGGGAPEEMARLEKGRRISSGSLDWTPDGRYLLVGMEAPSTTERSLWLISREDGSMRELTSFVSAGGRLVRPRVHPNGRDISVIAGLNRWEVWTMENLRSTSLRSAGAQSPPAH